jgi:hypothetical protein
MRYHARYPEDAFGLRAEEIARWLLEAFLADL